MRLTRFIRYAGLACIALLPLIGAEYRGQVKFGGLPLPGATVVATQGDKKVGAVTDPDGIYDFPDLPDGAWQFDVEKVGFTGVKKDVTIGSGLPGPVFDLEMLPLDKIDTVSAAPAAGSSAPAAVPGQTTSNKSEEPGTPSIVAANSKNNGKNVPATPGQASSFQRTNLKGSANAPQQAASEPAPEVTNELNQRAADGFLINGSAQNGASSPFAQNPAFGNRRRGGPRLYTYSLNVKESNAALDARQYSLTGQNTPRVPANNFTGGFSFGGPMTIPHLLSSRNAPLINIGYQRTTNRASTVSSGLVPDDAMRAGDFSHLTDGSGAPVQVFDPFTNQPFVGNQIPASRISPQAQALMQYYPKPNFTGNNAYNYQVPLIGNTHTDQAQFRINKSFKRRNLITGSYGLSDTRSDQATAFNFLDLTRILGMQATVSYRRSFTPRFYGTVTYQFSRQSVQNIPFFSNQVNVSGAAGITGNDQTPVNWGPPSLSFLQSGIMGLSDTNASINHNQSSIYSYVGVWSHGRHNITFGGDFRWQQFNTFSQNNARGRFTFNGASTQQVTTVDGLTQPVQNTGYDFAGFLLGVPDQSGIAFGNADKYFRSVSPDLYFKDDWKVTPGFSLTLGLRWEYTSPITELYGRLVNLDISPGFTAALPVLATAPTGPLTGIHYPSSLVRPDKHEFLPMPGFAWRPFPASSMVIRGGYGIGYNTGMYNTYAQQMAQQSPFSKSLQVPNSAANPLTLANGFYAPANVTTNTIGIDPNFSVGYAQVWNLSVQRDLPASLVMLATYTGTKGTHQVQALVPNTYPSGAVNPCGNCPTNFTYYTSGGNSTRESGAMQLRRRLHNGFTASLLYTYSKSMDDAASLGGAQGSVAQDWQNLRGEYGPSSIDQRHLVNIEMQYTSGMGVGGGALMTGWRGKLMKDWTFVDSIDAGSGFPLTPTYPELLSGVNETVRASYTGLSLYDAPEGHFLNPQAVTAPASGQWGNAGRNSIRGPGRFSMSASMQRTFKLNDRFNLSLRIDAVNPINHVVFTNWNTIVTNAQFGLPSQVNPMRSVSTNLRLTF